MSAEQRLCLAATALRETAAGATPGPWRVGHSKTAQRHSALISDTRHPGRAENGGWDWDEHYGGCLIAESLMPHDRTLIAMLDPLVAAALADWLDNAAEDAEMQGHDGPLGAQWDIRVDYNTEHAVTLADLILGADQ